MTSATYYREAIRVIPERSPVRLRGRIQQVVGTIAEASGPPWPLGTPVRAGDGTRAWELEVIGFRDRTLLLMPLDSVEGLYAGVPVWEEEQAGSRPTGTGLLGRILDGLGNPIDGKGPLAGVEQAPRVLPPVNPVLRKRIDKPLATGVRALDAFLTLGRGQKVGIFAGSGVGKSVLLGMIARNTAADVNVIALVGERGKEVREFLENDLGEAGLKKSVVIVVTSDESPLRRLKGAHLATAIAAGFRAEGKQVLLLMDSLTRVAHAQRELGLAVGEPPTTRGYPPSVFKVLPSLLEQAGPVGEGAITGIYTVLVEGDDFNEPVADLARSILEGHVVLARELANGAHYPAIDVLESLSRCFAQVATPEQRSHAEGLRKTLAAWKDVQDLVQIGAYRQGVNRETDQVLARMPLINAFLQQRIEEGSGFDLTLQKLKEVATTIPAPTAPAAAAPQPNVRVAARGR